MYIGNRRRSADPGCGGGGGGGRGRRSLLPFLTAAKTTTTNDGGGRGAGTEGGNNGRNTILSTGAAVDKVLQRQMSCPAHLVKTREALASGTKCAVLR